MTHIPEHEQVMRLLEQGVKITRIPKKTGISYQRVYQILLDESIKERLERDLELMRKLRSKGMTIRAIAQEMNCHPQKVCLYLNGKNPHKRSDKRQRRREEMSRAIELKKQGLTQVQIANEMGISKTLVWRLIGGTRKEV